MIKKALSFSLFSIVTATLSAQCTIDPNVFSWSSNYGLEPTSAVFNGSSMATATELQPYAVTFQIHIDPDTVTALGTFPITELVIDSIIGLPSGIFYNVNPSTTMLGGEYGCILVSGTAAAGTASGGPNNDGIYPVIAYVTATVNVLSVPTAFPHTVTDYQMRVVNDNIGLLEPAIPDAFKLIYNGTDINAGLVSFLNEELAAEIIDMNGNRLQSFTVYEGTNTFEVNHLKAGTYIVKVGESRIRLMKF